jgi:hypothetical protein
MEGDLSFYDDKNAVLPDDPAWGLRQPGSAPTVRLFPTGATRSASTGKHEYARFMDPLVIRAFGAYMTKHRVQPDGSTRAPDNWKAGIPRQAYMDSLWRHLMDLWELHTYGTGVDHVTGQPLDLVETLCAVLFNGFGFLFEVLKDRRA